MAKFQQLTAEREFTIGSGCVVKGSFGNSFDRNGRTYYVNNITGSSTNDGLSWNNPMDEVSTAITASEAWRQLQGTDTNDYVRNTIVVQGTGTPYTALTALPNYCDIVGLGAPANGNGAGIAVIGANGADGIAGTARGLGLYNLQIRSGGDFYCMDFVNLFRSTIQDCGLFAYAASTTGGMRFSGSSGGNIIRGNHWGSGVAHANMMTGMQIDGAAFDHNRIEDNMIEGRTVGIKVEAEAIQCGRTLFRNNIIGSISGEGCLIGVDDDVDNIGPYSAFHAIYANNFIIATTMATIIDGADTYWVGNITAHALTAATES